MTWTPSNSLLDALPFGLVVLDNGGSVLRANSCAEGLLGRSRAEISGRNFFVEFAAVPGIKDVERLFDGATALAGTALTSNLAGTAITVKAFPEGHTTLTLLVLENPSPQELRPGLPSTRQAVWEMMAGIRHEINNPLMAIMGLLELLLARTDLPETAVKKVLTIRTEASRIRDLLARASPVGMPVNGTGSGKS